MESETDVTDASEQPFVHTPGPWMVEVNRYPLPSGSQHIERRIVTQWEHPQAKAPLAIISSAIGVPVVGETEPKRFMHIESGDARLIAKSPTMRYLLIEFIDWHKRTKRSTVKSLVLGNSLDDPDDLVERAKQVIAEVV